MQVATHRENSPIFVLVRALSRFVVVKKGQVETGIEELVSPRSKQPDSVIFALPYVLLVVEKIQPNIGVKWRPEHKHVMANPDHIH